MAIPAERFAQLEAEVSQLKVSLDVHEASLEQQKKHLLDYIEKQFATTKLAMTEIAEGTKIEFCDQGTHCKYSTERLPMNWHVSKMIETDE